jgi:nonribosomal peptide synthetase DhbF
VNESQASQSPKSKIQNLESSHRLVAYIVATYENSRSLSDLLYAYLSARLPGYMIPAHFVMLNSLPLTANGKFDYRALPPIRFPAAGISVAPRNDIELQLQAIFAEVLGRSDVGINDNFFKLGGHSLLAARAAARISDAFHGLGLTLSDFLTAPTIKDLAEKVASSAGQRNTEWDKDDREEFDL